METLRAQGESADLGVVRPVNPVRQAVACQRGVHEGAHLPFGSYNDWSVQAI